MDQTLNVLIRLTAGGDLATQLKAQQKALTELDRTQTHLTATQRQQFQQARSSAGLGAALVASQIVGTRAIAAGLQMQARAQKEVTAAQGVAAGPGGLSQTARARIEDRMRTEMMSRKMRPSTVAKTVAKEMEDAWRVQITEDIKKAPGVAQGEMPRAKAELKMLRGEPSFKQVAYPAKLLDAGKEQLRLATLSTHADAERAQVLGQLLTGKEYEANAYARTRLAGVNELHTTREAAAMARQKAQWTANPEGQKALREQAKLQKEMVASQRQQRLGELTAEYGRFGGRVRLLGEDLQKLGGNVQQLGQNLQMAFAAGVAGMGAMVAAASPSHFATITGSVTLLAQSIGNELLPYADELSLRLQQAARWIKSLSPEAKNAAAQFAIWGIGIIGVTALLIKLGGAVLSAGAALKALGASTAVALAPAVGAVALLTAGVAALGVAWYLASQQTTAAARDMTTVSATLGKVQAGGASQAEMLGILGPDVQKRLEAERGNRAKQSQIFKEAADAAAAEAETRRKTLGDEAAAYKKAGDYLETGVRSAARVTGLIGPKPHEDMVRVAEKYLKEGGIADAEAQKMVRELFRAQPLWLSSFDEEKFKTFKEAPEIRLKEAEAREAAARQLAKTGLAGPGEELQRSLRGLPAPAFLQAAQLAEKFQLKLLDPKGPLDREIEINQLRAIKDLLMSIDNKTPKGEGGVPLFGSGLGTVGP